MNYWVAGCSECLTSLTFYYVVSICLHNLHAITNLMKLLILLSLKPYACYDSQYETWRGPSTLWHKHQGFTEAVCVWLGKPLSPSFTLEFPCMQSVLKYSSNVRWTHLNSKHTMVVIMVVVNPESDICRVMMDEATSSLHDATDSGFWHYRQTGRFLKLYWAGAQQSDQSPRSHWKLKNTDKSRIPTLN